MSRPLPLVRRKSDIVCTSRQREACQEVGILVQFSVVLQPCVDGGCTSNGACHEYFSGVFHFSSCSCYASTCTLCPIHRSTSKSCEETVFEAVVSVNQTDTVLDGLRPTSPSVAMVESEPGISTMFHVRLSSLLTRCCLQITGATGARTTRWRRRTRTSWWRRCC